MERFFPARASSAMSVRHCAQSCVLGRRVRASALRDRRSGVAAGPLARATAAASSSRACSVRQHEFAKAAQLVQ